MVYDLCFRKPRLTVLVLGLILVAGLTALNSLPRQEDPALTERYSSVTVTLPGASAERVEALITEKLENALQEVVFLDPPGPAGKYSSPWGNRKKKHGFADFPRTPSDLWPTSPSWTCQPGHEESIGDVCFQF